jgi:hypothetical protein
MRFGQRCVLVTNGNLASMLALGDWLQQYGHQLVKIYVTYRLPSSQNNWAGGLALLRHSGLSYLGLKVLINKMMPLNLRLAGMPYSVRSYVDWLGLDVPVEPVASVKTAAFQADLKRLGARSLVSFSATQRFPVEMIRLFSDGAVNVHYGALPQFAGLSPYFWHLHQGASEFGVTLHQIEEALDAGRIIDQAMAPVAPSTDCLELLFRMSQHVSPLLNRLFSGETDLAQGTPQDLQGRTYFKHPSRAQIKQFKSKGHTLASRQSVRQLKQAAKAAAQRH